MRVPKITTKIVVPSAKLRIPRGLRWLQISSLVTLTVLSTAAFGQSTNANPKADGNNGNGNGDGNGNGNGNKSTPALSNRPMVVPRNASADDSNGSGTSNGKGKGNPHTPDRSEALHPPANVQKLVDDFQTARENYLQQNKTLNKQLQDAREAMREQNKEMLQALKDQQKALREEARDRAKELKDQLHGDFGRVIDAGGGEGRGK